MGKTSKIMIWAVVAAIVAVAAVLISVHYANKKANAPAPGYQKAAGIKVENAPAGQIVSGFPKDLVLDSKAAIVSSYSEPAATPGGETMYTVDYRSSQTVQTLYNAYLKYLNGNKYNIYQHEYNDKNKAQPVAVFYAGLGNRIIDVTITKATGGQTNVLASYIVK